MKIAVYYDLPFGGAKVHTEAVLLGLGKKHELTHFCLPHQTQSFRLFRDFSDIILGFFRSYFLAQKINRGDYDAIYISHDRSFQAPWVLRFLRIPSVFFCQEPTRAFFEPELGIDHRWPLMNRIYETCIRGIKKRIEIKNAHHATYILVNSIYSQGVIKATYGAESTVVYPGVDRGEFAYSDKPRKNKILFIGNDEPQKRLWLAKEAVKLVKFRPKPKLVIVSPRSPISREGLVAQYQSARLTLATSLQEPFGFSVIESLACGTPVVAVSEGGYKETIVGGITGLTSSCEAVCLARNMDIILGDKSLGTKMGQAGRVDVQSRFSWENAVYTIEAILSRLPKYRH